MCNFLLIRTPLTQFDSSPRPVSLHSLILVSVGAEIPDTIASVTVAKRGYGSLATSNCMASQITNIALGLGMPWLISNLAGRCVARSSLIFFFFFAPHRGTATVQLQHPRPRRVLVASAPAARPLISPHSLPTVPFAPLPPPSLIPPPRPFPLCHSNADPSR